MFFFSFVPSGLSFLILFPFPAGLEVIRPISIVIALHFLWLVAFRHTNSSTPLFMECSPPPPLSFLAPSSPSPAHTRPPSVLDGVGIHSPFTLVSNPAPQVPQPLSQTCLFTTIGRFKKIQSIISSVWTFVVHIHGIWLWVLSWFFPFSWAPVCPHRTSCLLYCPVCVSLATDLMLDWTEPLMRPWVVWGHSCLSVTTFYPWILTLLGLVCLTLDKYFHVKSYVFHSWIFSVSIPSNIFSPFTPLSLSRTSAWYGMGTPLFLFSTPLNFPPLFYPLIPPDAFWKSPSVRSFNPFEQVYFSHPTSPVGSPS